MKEENSQFIPMEQLGTQRFNRKYRQIYAESKEKKGQLFQFNLYQI